MEKEKYEKPLFELITLLDTNIITISPEEGEVGDLDDDDESQSAPETANKMLRSILSPWLLDEEGNQILDEDGNPIAAEIENTEGTEDETGADKQPDQAPPVENEVPNEDSKLLEGLKELFGDIIIEDQGSNEPNETGGFVEDDQETTPTEPSNEEGTGW